MSTLKWHRQHGHYTADDDGVVYMIDRVGTMWWWKITDGLTWSSTGQSVSFAAAKLAAIDAGSRYAIRYSH